MGSSIEQEKVPHLSERTMETREAKITLYRGEGTEEEIQTAKDKIEEEGAQLEKVVVGDFKCTKVKDDGNRENLDYVLVRGKDMIITVQGNGIGTLKSGEKSDWYALYVGEDAVEMAVLSPDRQLARDITTALIKEFRIVKDVGRALRWLEEFSPYAKMKNPYDGKDLLSTRRPRPYDYQKKD